MCHRVGGKPHEDSGTRHIGEVWRDIVVWEMLVHLTSKGQIIVPYTPYH